MLKTKQEIEHDLQLALPRSKPFFRECLAIIREYDEAYLTNEMLTVQTQIKVYLYRRKHLEDKKLYKEELKINRRYLKGLKYLLVQQKKKRISKDLNPRLNEEEKIQTVRSANIARL